MLKVYEYRCLNCNLRFELNIKDIKSIKCNRCNSNNIKRVYSIGGIIFKGKGFYSTDNG